MKTYNVRISFESPYNTVLETIDIVVNANTDEDAHMLAISELELSLGQSLIIHDSIIIN